jgi:outer membrane protein assembly factor BamB
MRAFKWGGRTGPALRDKGRLIRTLRWPVLCLALAAIAPASRGDIFAIRNRFSGNLYSGNDIVRYSATGQSLGQFPEPTAYGGPLVDLSRGPDGNLYVIFDGDFGAGSIGRLNMANGAAYENVGPPGTISGVLHSVAFDPVWGGLYVNQIGLNPTGGTAVYRVDSTGTTLVARAGDARNLGDIAFSSAGNLFVGVGGVGIRRYASGEGGPVTLTIPVPSIGHFTFGPDGLLYVGTSTAGIQRFDPATGASLGTFVPAGAQGVTNPISFVFGDDGTLYVNDRSVQRILKFDAATGSPTGVLADYSGTGQPLFTIAYAVPEPASVGLVAAAVFAWTTARRRHRSRD